MNTVTVGRTIIVAGYDTFRLLETERDLAVERSDQRPGCFQSSPLVEWQRSVHSRGFRDVELVESIYGWSVRSGSGLDNFALLAGARSGQVDGSLEDASRWASAWCAEDPAHRYAWRRS